MDIGERQNLNHEIEGIVGLILDDYNKGRDVDNLDVFNQPDRDAVVDIVRKIMRILFPGYYRDKIYRSYNDTNRIAVVIEDVIYNMQKQMAIAFRHSEDYKSATDDTLTCGARCITLEFFRRIPHIRELVDTDLQATFDGDPAAYNKEEIILSYPGLMAGTINRIAHELYLLKVPLIPRMMTEYAHSITGIDIHPGATLGKYFMIDHGTGIVIGETSIIGEHVKIYQGVTIGALSTRGGQSLKGAKRHPTIEDNVTIYAGASILGGETIIGHDSVIGSNAFITSSICPGTKVSIKNQELQYNNGSDESVERKDLDCNQRF
ncbi:MAG: serine acetyltransferase [Butyrivibrio sp.]|uniref:serine O-acetyltransferase n=1 Tax=Butyrivibrio sp. NC2002 TaxID=1410610 RepID=UPI00055B84C7|nr:serine acetyltransferase [Butyrivibrio sp. NC2002]MBE5859108.1 serine acetyltransferase [Butyrivibrio sp.]